jgi:hypothetical protein
LKSLAFHALALFWQNHWQKTLGPAGKRTFGCEGMPAEAWFPPPGKDVHVWFVAWIDQKSKRAAA